MDLLSLEKDNVEISPYALVIDCYKKLWDRDKTKLKDVAKVELGYIVLMYKYNSPYIEYQELERSELLQKDLKLKIKSNDKDLQEACTYYQKSQEDSLPSLKYLIAARCAADKIRQFFNTFSLTATTLSGAVIYKPKDISSAIKDMGELIKSLDNLEDKVKRELSVSDEKIRGGGIASAFEDA